MAKALEKTIVFSTSITKGIEHDKFNRLYNGQVCNFRRFHGAKLDFIKEYAKIHLVKEMPDTVVVAAGGNDLSPGKSTLEIANKIIDCGVMSKMHGARKVVISSVMPRSNFHYQLGRHQLNGLLRKLCIANNFCFLENSNITLSKHIANDGVHLNFDGTKVLANNILNCLN